MLVKLVLPAGCWNDASRVSIQKGGLQIPHLIGGGKRIDISMWYSPFYFSWERTAKSIRTVQWRIRGEQSANGARSAWLKERTDSVEWVEHSSTNPQNEFHYSFSTNRFKWVVRWTHFVSLCSTHLVKRTTNSSTNWIVQLIWSKERESASL